MVRAATAGLSATERIQILNARRCDVDEGLMSLAEFMQKLIGEARAGPDRICVL